MLTSYTHALVGWQVRVTVAYSKVPVVGYVAAVATQPGKGQMVQLVGQASNWYALANCKQTGRYKAPAQAGLAKGTPQQVQAVLGQQKPCPGTHCTLAPSMLATAVNTASTSKKPYTWATYTPGKNMEPRTVQVANLGQAFAQQYVDGMLQWVPGHYVGKRYYRGRLVKQHTPWQGPTKWVPGANCVVG